jgi:hypothetical protein
MMTIQVNNKLIKGRNPIEYDFSLENQRGEIVHRLDDGANLIRFKQFQVKEQVKVNKTKIWMFVALEWYVYNEDLKIIL